MKQLQGMRQESETKRRLLFCENMDCTMFIILSLSLPPSLSLSPLSPPSPPLRTAAKFKTLEPFWGEEYNLHIPNEFQTVSAYVQDYDMMG